MDNYCINGLDLLSMLENGAKNLAMDVDRINSLNVFPVPDGDTGTNMRMTIEGGVREGQALQEKSISKISKAMARAMVLSARGNSGVILSQFFKGLSLGLEGYDDVDIKAFASAMVSGTNRAYSVVSNPTEGTILTVMREAGQNALDKMTKNVSLEDYLIRYLAEAHESLKKTPELLPILKKAGVIDSGGAGFVLIVEGMLRAVNGDILEAKENTNSVSKPDISGFTADSELTYGYCTEFILSLIHI